uniref:Uncharacterized protein n=1 Tax=Kalanchoe fedtschenkoi TaxID=63787 RepID=A0A7N0T0H1_KALFE
MFLPVDVHQASGTHHTGNVQINVFKCGGVAIGLCASHKILDGVGLGVFMNAWAASARGELSAIISPDFSSVSVFPTESSWLREATLGMWGAMVKPGNFVTKRFLFDSASVAQLKDEVASSSKGRPTRVEAVSALLWKSFIKGSSGQRDGVWKASVMTHLVNLRRRVRKDTLPITDRTLCNLLWIASAAVPAADIEPELSELCEKVRASIARVDKELVHKLRSDEAKAVVSELCKGIITTSDGSNVVGFTSWCKLGLYEADFGWGRPVWISSIGVKGCEMLNLVVLVDSRDGDGIEAWVSMDESDINALQQDAEVRKFASVDPSPLVCCFSE